MRPASELDSIMEFGLAGAILLASSSLAGRRPAANRSQTRSETRSATSSRAGRRPASELDRKVRDRPPITLSSRL